MRQFVRRVHFVGIGGVGMSGIAQVLLNLGFSVSGSDLKDTELTRRLRRAGAKVHLGHRAAHAAGAEVVVVSSAVAAENPEARWARAHGVPVVPRVAMLAELARLKKTITVAGSHGKTTTTAMVGMALQAAGVDPTVVVGGQVANLMGANARVGLGDYLVAEADESDGSFLSLFPLVAVVTNIDDDHLDHYGTMENLKAAFREHLGRLPFYGLAVVCGEDANAVAAARAAGRPVLTYALDRAADWRGKVLPALSGKAAQRLEVKKHGRRWGTLDLRVPGRHNALNALAAAAAADFIGCAPKKVAKGLSDFRGVGRRLERLGSARGVLFIDDYGHHPTEVRATLAAMRGSFAKGRRLVVVFQPHRYTRTRQLWRQFGPALKGADAAYVLPVYAAGEKPIRGVSSGLIIGAARRAGVAARPFTRAVDLACELAAGDVVLTLGAGDVWKVGADLLRRLEGGTLSDS
ncbi:MAG: UDP-N-acetylmuramate--L-alanine ligase [Elusimicrobia bacterium]|nr:UDP-N-acetylmuramate--L-alanine ligase [Elusimicrobiota bacterium]